MTLHDTALTWLAVFLTVVVAINVLCRSRYMSLSVHVSLRVPQRACVDDELWELILSSTTESWGSNSGHPFLDCGHFFSLLRYLTSPGHPSEGLLALLYSVS